uniref:Zinc finger SWIM-type containing 9 n=1 Tax=Cricetulus griseus TaxID=10029 RepID=A0A8C2LNP8_CRIGR
MELTEPPPDTAVQKEEQELLDRAFFSWAEFSRFFDKWCQQRLVVFSVKSSTHVARSPWASTPPLYRLIHVLKYSYVLLVCKDVRVPNQSPAWPPQPSCPAFITVKLSPLRDRLVVSECQLTHSHPACPREFAYHFRPGHLLANACLPVRITNKISKQFVAPADVRRLLSHCKGPDHGVLDALQVLEGLFRTDPEAKVKLVFVEDQAMVETVFLLTSRTRALLRRFPRILLVDRLPGLQGALDLMAVLCVDSAGRARQTACCVARPGTPSLLRFMLVSLLQSAPDVKGRVRCLTAGPEVAGQLRAVRQLLPCARVQICRAQGLETLFSKAQELGGASQEDPDLWPLLCRLADSKSYTAYSEALAELRSQAPTAFIRYFEHNWAPRHDMWVRFRAYEATRDLDACALVRGHRRRLLRRLNPSHSVAQCLRDLVAMQWADATGEAASEGAHGDRALLESEPRNRAQTEKHKVRGAESSNWGGPERDSEKGKGFQSRDPQGVWSENQKVRGPEGTGAPLEKEHLRGPEVRDWRGSQVEDGRARVLGPADRRGTQVEPEKTDSLEGSPWRGVRLQEEQAPLANPRDWKGLQFEMEKGVDVRKWQEARAEKPLELVPENGEQRGPQWGGEGQKELEIAEEKDGRFPVKRRRGLEDIVVVHLEGARAAGIANGGEGGPQTVSSKNGGQQMEFGDPEGRLPGLGNGVLCTAPVRTVLEGNPEWAVARVESLATGEIVKGGGEEGPGEPKRLCRPCRDEGVDCEPLAKFRAACGPELADLVAEELAFARQHGTRGFHWTGAGFALKDGTSDFFLDGALTHCSCSIHAARRLPCRHLFAARLLTGAALFHMDLLRDCWGRSQEP